MKMLKTFKCGRDCKIEIECENCGYRKALKSTCGDKNYLDNVISYVKCPKCGKSTRDIIDARLLEWEKEKIWRTQMILKDKQAIAHLDVVDAVYCPRLDKIVSLAVCKFNMGIKSCPYYLGMIEKKGKKEVKCSYPYVKINGKWVTLGTS